MEKELTSFYIIGCEETYTCVELQERMNEMIGNHEETMPELVGQPFLEKGPHGEGWCQTIAYYKNKKTKKICKK